ncbi:probable receptor-like protein kinase At3g17420 isoform X2 [Tripterygium wilfordii]|uniref:probable receptor-like protein kinase At3g17420 isoform X2 n=1 Tax=Tripterygium wilfordii TaxID=458696 RepID=UPI0018F83E85|nr:probable receptor-like protein kinase At3g17420 isoform X2 [Tripterygium wilfordii]
MTFVQVCTVAGGTAGDGGENEGKVVVVGVKLDSASRELLTWSLVKVAQPGDRVTAVHVLDSIAEGPSSLLSLVKTFDSVLSVYEGFCNLKQVDLQLKVCRGSKVRKILVKEAKASGAAKLVVGISKTPHTIRSSISVAKYCARKLSPNVSVFAVGSGKVVFQRDAVKLSQENWICSPRSDSDSGSKFREKICKSSAVTPVLEKNSGIQFCENSQNGSGQDNSLSIVPFQTGELVLSSNTPELKQGCQLLRRVFISRQRQAEKSSAKKTSVLRWLLALPSRYASTYVHPDQKQNNSDAGDDHTSSLDEENGAIVPVGSDVLWSPVSPSHDLNDIPEELLGLHEKYSSTCRLFSYKELSMATSDFKPENLVGKGGSGYVYRGYLPDGKELAVKILKPYEDVLKEFVSEIEIITQLHHKNLISLFGYCFENNNLALVYDFLSRGSLEENLHEDVKAFSWRERYEVAVGVAEALEYLHNCSAQPVIHRDVKSSNILLSEDFEPQLSDFGLASWVSTSSSLITCTDVAGTFGYLAPEYFMHGKVSDKMDVYAFGVVLLELLSGRKPICGEQPKGQESLVMWARPILKDGKITRLLDPRLSDSYDFGQIERMVLAASLCIRRSPKSRPQIRIVLKLLQGDEQVTNWAKQQLRTAEVDEMDGEAVPTNIQSHLNLALLDLEDDSLSISSNEQSVSLEDYLQGRWSRTSSFP